MGIYTVKNVKSFLGMEGYGYNATLYCEGKKVGFAIDDARGGCVHIDFTTKEASKSFYDHLDTLPLVETDMQDPHDKTKPFTYKIDDTTFLSQLVDSFEQGKWWKRQTKNKTLFKIVGDKEESWRTITSPISDKNINYLITKYGDSLVNINNKPASFYK